MIYNFKNLSYIDGATPFGDYKTAVEVGSADWGYSEDLVAYTFINSFEIFSTSPALIDPDGDTLYLNGTGLLATSNSKC